VQARVEECDDGNMEDTDTCVGGCVEAVCGDGFVNVGVEACDDANMANTDTCTNACVAASCGDGFLQMGEQCDDGDLVADDGCSAMCQLDVKLVFVTSTVQTGNMGGLAGADAICNALAQAANLPGTYMAWLSTSLANGTPAGRFTQSAMPYVKVDGVKVADNWGDLVDGSPLDSAINKTELDGPPPGSNTSCGPPGFPSVYTATNSSGMLAHADYTCSNWTSTGGDSVYGDATQTGTWTDQCAGSSCSDLAAIYCFQQ
jgi:cysteine-rich repeat protein